MSFSKAAPRLPVPRPSTHTMMKPCEHRTLSHIPPLRFIPIVQPSKTSCEPGPPYWYINTLYLCEGLKSEGFIIQPFSFTPSPVVKLNNSFCGIVTAASFSLRVSFDTKVFSVFPALLIEVTTGG